MPDSGHWLLRRFGPLRSVLANPSIRRAEAAWVVAIAAEWTYMVSLLVFAYAQGGVLAVGLVSTLRTLPAALLAPFLGPIADRYPRPVVLSVVHGGRLLAVMAVAISASLGTTAAGWLAGVLVAVTVEGSLATLHRPATMSLMPSLARSPEELVATNAVTSLGEGVGLLVGPALGGVLVALGGPPVGVASAAVLLGVATTMVRSVSAPALAPRVSVGARAGSHLRDTVEGLRALARFPYAGLVVGLFGSQTLVRGALGVLVVAASVDLLGLGESGVGWLNAAIGAGGLVGALLALAFVGGGRLAKPFSVSLAAWGIPIALIGVLPVPALAFGLLAAVGIANATLDVSGFTLLQRCVPNALRARTFGLLEALVALTIALGALLAPLLVELVGLEWSLIMVGSLLPTLALLSAPVIRHADAAAIVPRRQLDLLRGIPMLAPLPLTASEQLARSLQPLRWSAGQELMRQGESGDRYVIVATGSAEVVHDGRVIARVGPGDGIGEIALLDDRPRTATVRALEDGDGYALPREAFLEAVTGSSQSRRIADDLVADRLARAGH